MAGSHRRFRHWTGFSKNGVGRTGFEPVTSSVSGNSGAAPGVCHRRAESNWELSTCGKNLAGSCYVRGRLKTLAPISGSRRGEEGGVQRGAVEPFPGMRAGRHGEQGGAFTG